MAGRRKKVENRKKKAEFMHSVGVFIFKMDMPILAFKYIENGDE